MSYGGWATLAGALLVLMALSATLLARLPLSTAMLYLAVGVAASPWGFGWTALRLEDHAAAIERLAEAVVLISLFTAGLKMSAGLGDGRWQLPLRLASVSMLVTVACMAAAGVLWLGLSAGAAILLGAILAPTDPVLASEVQMSKPGDRDRLRFALTGEGGMNDGTAFPFVMLGLGLLGLHELGAWGWRWVAVDVVWAVAAGVGIGAGVGTAIGTLVLHLRRQHHEAVGLDNFLALGLIALAYGLSLWVHAYGFLAVFTAGVALRQVELRGGKGSGRARDPQASDGEDTDAAAEATVASPRAIQAAHGDPDVPNDALAVHPARAPAFMAHAVLSFNEQLERIGEVVAVVCVGMLLWSVEWHRVDWWFVVAVLVLVRPFAVAAGLVRSTTDLQQRVLIGWFGIRGIGSLYYLGYALTHGLAGAAAHTVVALTLATVVASTVLHGVSVTPLMARYERWRKGRRR